MNRLEQPLTFSTVPTEPHLLAVFKPVGANVGIAEDMIEAYRRNGYMDDGDIVETVEDNDETSRLIAHKLATGYDGVVNLAGDGTGQIIGQTIYEADEGIRDKTALIITGLGTQNDAYHTVFDTGSPRPTVLANMPTARVHPLKVNLSHSGNGQEGATERAIIALLYNSVGYTAKVAEGVDDDAHRDTVHHSVDDGFIKHAMRRGHEIKVALQELVRSDKFYAYAMDADSESGWQHDLVQINGIRLGGLDTGYGDFLRPEFYEGRTRSKLELLWHASELALRNYVRLPLQLTGLRERTIADYTLYSRYGEDLTLQSDGQHRKIPSSTRMRTEVAPKTLWIAAPALAAAYQMDCRPNDI